MYKSATQEKLHNSIKLGTKKIYGKSALENRRDEFSNCALTIQKYLEEKGLENVRVNFIGGDVSFDLNGNITKPAIEKGIENLGYRVADESGGQQKIKSKKLFKNHLQHFIFCFIF